MAVQLSDTMPHIRVPHFEVFGVQPHTFAVPPPLQVWGDMQLLGQVPLQLSEPPHLPEHRGVQPQTFAVPPPLQL